MPGLTTQDDWLAWSQGLKTTSADEGPSVSQIPPMLRRRLSPLGKMAASVAWPLLQDDVFIPSVFCSRHGELDRTVTMLRNLALNEQLSPTHFSLSVHNAIGGVYSIARKDPSAITALAVGDEGLSQALLETQLIMVERDYPEALCVIYDAPMPPEYSEPKVQPNLPYAAAFVLTRGAPDQAKEQPAAQPQKVCGLSLQPSETEHAECSEPHTLAFLRFLLSDASALRLPGKRHDWLWTQPARSQ